MFRSSRLPGGTQDAPGGLRGTGKGAEFTRPPRRLWEEAWIAQLLPQALDARAVEALDLTEARHSIGGDFLNARLPSGQAAAAIGGSSSEKRHNTV